MSQAPEFAPTPDPDPEPKPIPPPVTPPPKATVVAPEADAIPVRGSGTSLISNGVLMLLGAALAAGGYGLARVYSPPRPPGEVTGPAANAIKPEDFKSLTDRVDALKSDVDKVSQKVDARPDLAPEIKGIRDRLDEVARTVSDQPKRIDSINAKLETVTKAQGPADAPKLDALEKQVAELAQAVHSMRSEGAGRSPTPQPAPAGSLEEAEQLFKKGKYVEARNAFATLSDKHKDDPRVWYYSALANGFATKDWKGETERLLERGIASEKTGGTPAATIDAAFADLTKAQGKDWLEFYRKQAKPQ